jgi:hypothetical protein
MAKKLCFYLVLLIGSSLILFAACTPQELEPVPVERRLTPVPTLVKMENAIVEPRPNFISALTPPEYYIVPISLYNYHPEGVFMLGVSDYDPMAPDSYEFGFQSSICIKPRIELLIQQGDIFVQRNQEGERLEERMELFINGKLVEAGVAGIAGGLIYDQPTQEPQSLRTIGIIGAGYCWKVPLSVGQHEVTFRFHQTSGDIKTYTWHFEISQ